MQQGGCEIYRVRALVGQTEQQDMLFLRSTNGREGKMADTQKIKLGLLLLAAQIVMLAMTLGFIGLLDRQAREDGIYTIITEGK